MPKKPSSFDRESYRGYTVSLKLVRENLEEYGPVGASSPRDVYNFMHGLKDNDRERMYFLHLETKNSIVNCEEVSCGTPLSSPIHPREVFKSAILSSCASMILVHNHPSGNANPSPEDRNIARVLSQGGDILGIDLLDSIIIGENSSEIMRECSIS